LKFPKSAGNLLREFLERMGLVAFPAYGVDQLKVQGSE
jgi:hypothetical protein